MREQTKMMWRIANESTLKRLSYHALWGLQKDASNRPTLYDAAKNLYDNKQQREQTLREVLAITSQTGILGALVRFVCWVLNWNNYRSNLYNLMAYYSWRLYQERSIMLTLNNNSLDEHQPLTITEKLSIFAAEIFSPLLTSSSQALTIIGNFIDLFSKELVELLDGDADFLEIDLSMQTPRQDTHFIVTQAMLEPLACLGLSTEVDGFVAYSKLSEAYKKSCLKAHPDRPTGSNEAFCKVKTAHETLTSLIKAINDPLGLKAAMRDRIEQREVKIAGLAFKLKKIKQQIYKDNARINTNGEQVDKYVLEANKYIQNANKYIQDTKEYIQDTKEYIQDTKEYIQDTKEYIQDTKEYIQDTKEYIQSAKEYMQRVDNLGKMIAEEKKAAQEHRAFLLEVQEMIRQSNASEHNKDENSDNAFLDDNIEVSNDACNELMDESLQPLQTQEQRQSVLPQSIFSSHEKQLVVHRSAEDVLATFKV